MESKYLNERLDFAKEIIAILLQKYEYASILGKDVYGKSIRVTNRAKSIGDTFEKQCGFVIKVYHQGIYSEYSFAKLEKDLIPEIVKNVENSLNVSQGLLKDRMNLTMLDDEPLEKDFDRPTLGKKYSTEEMFNIASKVTEEIAKKDERIVQCGLIIETYTVNSFFVSRNRKLTQSFTWNMVLPICVVREESNIKYARRAYLGNNMEEALNKAQDEGIGVVDDAIALLKAERIEPKHHRLNCSRSIWSWCGNGYVCEE